MILETFLILAALPFVALSLFFGTKNGYYDSDDYNGDFDTCIALRTAISKNNKFYVQAGAGIVADSKPEKEFAETVNKAKALMKAVD